jgi:glycine reductase
MAKRPIRVMHFMNQYFAGLGGEDKADVSAGHFEGPVGPGKRLQELLGDSAEIVLTTYCGDNYFPAHRDEVLNTILKIATNHNVKMLAAGPAFFSGRHGFACVEVCHAVSSSLDLPCVAAMAISNPALAGYRQKKDRRVFIFPTAETVIGMEEALERMARALSKLASGSVMGPASEEGYIPRGLRIAGTASKTGVARAVDMLLNRLSDRPFATEIPIEVMEQTPIAPRVVNLKDASIAMASTAGVHAAGNPHGAKPVKNKVWAKYPIGNLNSMKEGSWMLLHAGITSLFITDTPDYGAPLDACRELEREGAFLRLSPDFYSTTGVSGAIADMERIGKEMVRDMKAEKVDGILLVST